MLADQRETSARIVMCGFTGIALFDMRREPDAATLDSMTRSLVHRGPDDQGICIRGPLSVGFRRLSIIDVESGHQPIFNETNDVAVICNGEIYNFQELRSGLEARGHVFRTQSDVETIVHLYEEHGADCARHLVGMFAGCVLDWRDPREPKILLFRDRIGIKPVFYAETPDGIYFASEPKAILAGGVVGRRLRAQGLLEFLVAGYTTGTHSAWDGIKRLSPASTLSWSPLRGSRIERYWDLPLDALREPASNEEIVEWLDRVVREHLLSDVPLGAFLSGGVDSNAVVDSMARARRGPTDRASQSIRDGLILCTVGFHEKRFSELETARASAARLSAVHHAEILEADPKLAIDTLPWFFDEPLADPSTLPTYLVSKMAREHVTVALTGDGGDEVFAGYRRYVFDVAENRVRHVVGHRGQRLLALIGRGYPKLDWAPRVLRAKSVLENFGADPARAYWASFTQLSRASAVALLNPDLARAIGDFDPFDAFAEHYRRPKIDDPLYRAQYADFHGFLPDQILVKGDRASMAVSLESRPPLLDHRFVERFACLPAREKVRGGRGKHAFREALRPRLPASLLDGKKMGFEIPLRDWLRGPLAPAVAESLETLPAQWFDRDVLKSRFAEHRSGLTDHSHLLWSLLVLEHWRRRHAVSDIVAEQG